MKLIRENINEEFREKSDPITDMEIGSCQENIEKIKTKLQDMFDENYEIVAEYQDGSKTQVEYAWTRIDVIQQIQELVNKLF